MDGGKKSVPHKILGKAGGAKGFQTTISGSTVSTTVKLNPPGVETKVKFALIGEGKAVRP